MWMAHDSMGWWMVFGALATVAFWGTIIALIVWIAKSFAQGQGRERQEPPLEAARRRYAQGEISREEFEEIRRTLG